jgi:hypothetical protein
MDPLALGSRGTCAWAEPAASAAATAIRTSIFMTLPPLRYVEAKLAGANALL